MFFSVPPSALGHGEGQPIPLAHQEDPEGFELPANTHFAPNEPLSISLEFLHYIQKTYPLSFAYHWNSSLDGQSSAIH